MLCVRTTDFQSLYNKYYYIMAKKFDVIIESALRRYNQNTLIVGDRVKFIENWASSDWAKACAQVKLERLKEMLESGDNIRVSAVKSLRPTTADSGHFEIIDDVYYDIVREAAPGLYLQVFTVPQQIVEWLDDYPNLAGETPDSQKRDDSSHIDAREVDAVGNDVNMSVKQQTRCDHPAKEMPGSNVPLDFSPKVTDGSSYTTKYLES